MGVAKIWNLIYMYRAAKTIPVPCETLGCLSVYKKKEQKKKREQKKKQKKKKIIEKSARNVCRGNRSLYLRGLFSFRRPFVINTSKFRFQIKRGVCSTLKLAKQNQTSR